MDIFDELSRQAKESNERWEKIDKAIGRIKEYALSDNLQARTIDLLFLLVEQLRPAAVAGEKVEELKSEIQNMLDSLGGNNKK